MSSGKLYQKEAENLLREGGMPSEIAEKFQLAASEFAEEGKTEEANKCRSMYEFFSGLSCLLGAYTLDDVKEAVKHFQKTKKQLKDLSDSDAQAFSELAEGQVILAKGMLELWKENLDKGIKLLEKADQHFLQIKDRQPTFSDMAEVIRLEALSEGYFAKAIMAFSEGDSTSSTSCAGESMRLTNTLISKANGDSKKFYVGVRFLRHATLKLISLATNIVQQDRLTTDKLLKETHDLLTQSIEEFSTIEIKNPRVEALRMYGMGMQAVIEAVSDYQEGLTALYTGNPHSAKKKFENAFEHADDAVRTFSEIGQWGKPVLPAAISVRDEAKRHSTSITLATKRAKRRIAVDASKQFGLVFFISLATFIVLNYTKLLQTGALDQIYFSLIVAAITAFGLNALKLKEFLIPSHSSETTESASSSK